MAHRRRPDHQRWADSGPVDRHHAAGGDLGEPAGAGLLHGLHAGRFQLQPVLRHHVPVHRIHDRRRYLQQHRPAVRLLGAGGRMLLPAHRLLVHPAGGGRRREEGLHRHQVWRPGVAAGDPLPVLQWQQPGDQRAHRRRPCGNAGRPIHHLAGRGHLRGSGGQVGPVPPPRVASRRHGRPHTGQRPDPRRHHGCRRRLPGGPASSRCSAPPRTS